MRTCQNCSLDPHSTFPKVAIVGVGTQHPFFTVKENSEEFVAIRPFAAWDHVTYLMPKMGYSAEPTRHLKSLIHIPFKAQNTFYVMFSGPVESSARNHQAVIPTSKKHKNGNGTSPYESTAPSKSERLNSPNTSKWEPDVRMLLSTSQWLKVHIALCNK